MTRTAAASAVVDSPSRASVRTLAIDRSHSEVAFQVRHLLSKVRGRFTSFEGTIRFDEAQPERSHVQVVINAASIDTSEQTRDGHLRSADFFDVDEHPTLMFESTSLVHRGGNAYDVSGTLTIRGTARPVTINASFLGTMNDPWGNEKFVFEGELTLNRKDFGLNWNAALEAGGFLVGDEVKVTLAVQAQ